MCEIARSTKGSRSIASRCVEVVGGVGKKGEHPEGDGCGGVEGVEKKEVDVGSRSSPEMDS